MKDIYLQDKKTGELIPSQKIFKDFYKNHSAIDSVFDFYNETRIEVKNSKIDMPNFVKCINQK